MAGSAPSLADVGRHAGPLARPVACLNRRDGSGRGKQGEQGGTKPLDGAGRKTLLKGPGMPRVRASAVVERRRRQPVGQQTIVQLEWADEPRRG
jgi:hypothetical protein